MHSEMVIHGTSSGLDMYSFRIIKKTTINQYQTTHGPDSLTLYTLTHIPFSRPYFVKSNTQKSSHPSYDMGLQTDKEISQYIME